MEGIGWARRLRSVVGGFSFKSVRMITSVFNRVDLIDFVIPNPDHTSYFRSSRSYIHSITRLSNLPPRAKNTITATHTHARVAFTTADREHQTHNGAVQDAKDSLTTPLLLEKQPTTTLRGPSTHELNPRAQSRRRSNDRRRRSLEDQAQRGQIREVEALRQRRCREAGAGRHLGRCEGDEWTRLEEPGSLSPSRLALHGVGITTSDCSFASHYL